MEGSAHEGRHSEPALQDPYQLRISDDDRHRVAEVLRTAAGEGRIDLGELDERLEATYAAKTYADLVPITMDLPVPGVDPGQAVAPDQTPARRPAQQPSVPGPSHTGSFAVMSETKRTGFWTVQDGHSAFALMGSVVLDLREATFAQRDVTINASAVMGEVKVVVGATTNVVVDGFGVMGEFNEQRAKVTAAPSPDRPVVRLRGFALMGSVHVQRRPMPGEARKRLGWSGR